MINEYRLNKRGSKVPAVIDLGNKWPTGKANPLTRYLYLVLWLKWYTNHGEPRMTQHFPLFRPWSFGFILSPARMLDKCLEVCRDVFLLFVFCLFFLIQWFACLARSCAASVGCWGNSSFLSFYFFVGGDRGRALKFYNPGIVCGHIVNFG